MLPREEIPQGEKGRHVTCFEPLSPSPFMIPPPENGGTEGGQGLGLRVKFTFQQRPVSRPIASIDRPALNIRRVDPALQRDLPGRVIVRRDHRYKIYDRFDVAESFRAFSAVIQS